MFLYQLFEKVLGCATISAELEEDINDLTILIYRTPKVELFSLYSHEDFVDEKSISVTLMAAS